MNYQKIKKINQKRLNVQKHLRKEVLKDKDRKVLHKIVVVKGNIKQLN